MAGVLVFGDMNEGQLTPVSLEIATAGANLAGTLGEPLLGALVGDDVAVRPVMTMTLSVDHRVLDGAMAAAFLRDVKRVLENPYLLI
jgi:pyruvate dehydrogenase E2 component (dihydrolipoamide acetyltransferase)